MFQKVLLAAALQHEDVPSPHACAAREVATHLALMGLIGRRLYVPSTYRQWMYVALACGFVAFHVTHTSIVYARNYPHHAATGDVR